MATIPSNLASFLRLRKLVTIGAMATRTAKKVASAATQPPTAESAAQSNRQSGAKDMHGTMTVAAII